MKNKVYAIVLEWFDEACNCTEFYPCGYCLEEEEAKYICTKRAEELADDSIRFLLMLHPIREDLVKTGVISDSDTASLYNYIEDFKPKKNALIEKYFGNVEILMTSNNAEFKFYELTQLD